MSFVTLNSPCSTLISSYLKHQRSTQTDLDLRLIFFDGDLDLHLLVFAAVTSEGMRNALRSTSNQEKPALILVKDFSVSQGKILLDLIYNQEAVIQLNQKADIESLAHHLGINEINQSISATNEKKISVPSVKKIRERTIRPKAKARPVKILTYMHSILDEDSQESKLQIDDDFHEEKVPQSWKDNFEDNSMLKECYICKEKHLGLHLFTSHLRTHTSVKGPYQCPICRKELCSHGLALHEHMKKHCQVTSSEDSLFCSYPECQGKKKFKTKAALEKHLSTEHNHLVKLSSYKCVEGKCQTSPFICYNAKDFTGHMVDVHSKKPFQCKICSARYMHKASLEDHITAKHMESNIVCDICGKKFGNKALLQVHRKDQHELGDKRMVECDICGFQSLGIRNLRKHKKKHDGQVTKKYQCSYCSRMFGSKFSVDVHERTHTGEAPYKCGICSVYFKRSHHLNAHLRTSNHVNKKRQMQAEGVSLPDSEVCFDKDGRKSPKEKKRARKRKLNKEEGIDTETSDIPSVSNQAENIFMSVDMNNILGSTTFVRGDPTLDGMLLASTGEFTKETTLDLLQ